MQVCGGSLEFQHRQVLLQQPSHREPLQRECGGPQEILPLHLHVQRRKGLLLLNARQISPHAPVRALSDVFLLEDDTLRAHIARHKLFQHVLEHTGEGQDSLDDHTTQHRPVRGTPYPGWSTIQDPLDRPQQGRLYLL